MQTAIVAQSLILAQSHLPVRGQSSLSDIITLTWCYHTDIIISIPQTYYYLSHGFGVSFRAIKGGKKYLQKALSLQLFKFIYMIFPLKYRGIMSLWYYHICVILGLLLTFQVSHRRDSTSHREFLLFDEYYHICVISSCLLATKHSRARLWLVRAGACTDL